MTMATKQLSGGGLSSNKLVHPDVKGGSRSTEAMNPRGVSQFGYSPGSTLDKSGSFTTKNSALPVFEGNKAAATPMGNTLAASCPEGPGGGRTVHRSGMQGKH
jgi:hypothetical protein